MPQRENFMSVTIVSGSIPRMENTKGPRFEWKIRKCLVLSSRVGARTSLSKDLASCHRLPTNDYKRASNDMDIQVRARQVWFHVF